MTDGADHYDDGKLPIGDIPPVWEVECAKVLLFGATKYPDQPNDDGFMAPDYMRGMSYRSLYGSIRRHLTKWMCGERVDPESACHHLAHAGIDAMFLFFYDCYGLGTDDRGVLEPGQLGPHHWGDLSELVRLGRKAREGAHARDNAE